VFGFTPFYGIHKLSTTLLKSKLRNHQLLYNSTMNNYCCYSHYKKLKITVIEEFNDQNENILLVRVMLDDAEIVLGSIYGPNTTDREFYRNIDNFLTRNKNLPVVLGGDWNTTWDNSQAHLNIDVMGMVRTPNS
jgi:hypothetical protein